MTTLTLSAAGLDPLTISPATGYIRRAIDNRHAQARPVVQNAPDTDGELDQSSLHGGGSITLGLRLAPGAESFAARERRLRAFANARLRPVLTFIDDDDLELQATLSRGTVDAAIEEATHRDVIAQWMVPAGVWESAELHSVEVAGSDAGALGRAYDLTFDRTYPASAPEGEVEAVNLGDRDAYPLIQLHGPWSGLTRAENVTTGKAIVLDGENVTAGNYIEIDTRAKTITLNGLSSQSRYQRLVFGDTDWWSLVPGVNALRFEPTTFTAPARMVVAWRDAYS